jgi:hypothetical protein
MGGHLTRLTLMLCSGVVAVPRLRPIPCVNKVVGEAGAVGLAHSPDSEGRNPRMILMSIVVRVGRLRRGDLPPSRTLPFLLPAANHLMQLQVTPLT